MKYNINYKITLEDITYILYLIPIITRTIYVIYTAVVYPHIHYNYYFTLMLTLALLSSQKELDSSFARSTLTKF